MFKLVRTRGRVHTNNKFFSGRITKFFQGGKTNFDVFPEVELRKFKHLKRDHSVSKSLKKSDFTTQKERLIFWIFKSAILTIVGTKIQTFVTRSQCFKITQKV